MSTYIYAYFNDDWHAWFYVGVGTKERAHSISSHTQHIQKIFSHHNARVVLLREFPDECDNAFIDQCEACLKAIFRSMGEPIIDGQPENLRRQRQAEGIAIAKANGVYKGRKPIDVDDDAFAREYAIWKAGNCTARTAMARLGLKPNTFYRRVKEYENEK